MATAVIDRSAHDEAVEESVALARRLLLDSESVITRRERADRDRLGRLIADPDGRELVFGLTDEVLRVGDDRRAAQRFAAIVDQRLTETGVGVTDRLMLRAGAWLAPRLPRVVMPLVRRRLLAELDGVVLPADEPEFSQYVERRVDAGVRLNVNPLGEAILSDAEADARLQTILARIARPDVDYVSLKISAVAAHLDPLAFDHSVERICDRLRTVYRAATSAEPTTFINLDMEEYRDLELSLVSFMRVLDEPEFAGIDAGIVLQAYLPDSHGALDRLGAWATERHARHGGRIKIRLVKGANLAMEQVEAELHGWTAAPYGSKAEVDASFLAMFERALDPAWADAVRIGVGSHNLFHVAWTLVTAERVGATDRVEIEMLEGMAPAQARAVHSVAGHLLMYAPVVSSDDVEASIAYLARRLDENTQPANFLRALFDLEVDGPEWCEQEARFRQAVTDRTSVPTERRRGPTPRSTHRSNEFSNEPDADLTDERVRSSIEQAVIPRPEIHQSASNAAIDTVVARAGSAFERWAGVGARQRHEWCRAVADQMRRERFETLALMADETGKTVHEADPEISEAIDFAEYYGGPGIELLERLDREGSPVGGRGVVCVIGPWNFPYAIPTGGVMAALAAGNAVILKPAPESVRTAAWIVEQVHRAGVPEHLVQLVVCEDGPVGRHLVTHPDIDTVVLTGSWDTARLFRSWRPDLRLFAETSGKNALVITASADLDLAIADLVRSAFGHAGQKCSAASLAIVEGPVYDDPAFQRRLRDTTLSWRVGWPSNPATMIGPVIAPPAGPLQRALHHLEPGERWLVEPRQLDDTGRLWRPGVRVDVTPGSWFHQTECFGPALGVIRADDLDHAIDIQNAVAYGLTGGIHALDPAEIEQWLARVQVGNAYVNRHITGAVVQRQPFGGWKRSSIGPGTKAGGPNYLLQFARLATDDRAVGIDTVEGSYRHAWNTEFSREHDPSGLRSEANVLRYLPVDRMVVRHDGSDDDLLERLRVASAITDVELVESCGSNLSDGAFVASLRPTDRVRLLTAPNEELRRDLIDTEVWFDTTPPSAHGRLELVKWVREQAISRTLHRHGRLGPRAGRSVSGTD